MSSQPKANPVDGSSHLPSLAGFQVVNRNGQEVYSRYSQGQIDLREQQAEKPQTNFNADEGTIYKQSEDQFKQARQDALRTGKFDYGTNYSNAFYSPPSNYVNDKGQRVDRVSANKIPTPTSSISPVSFGYNDYEVSKAQQIYQAKQEQPTLSAQKQGKTLEISQSQLERTNSLRAQEGLQPLEQIANVKVVASTNEIDRYLAPSLAKGYQTLQVTDKNGNVIANIPLKGAGKQLNSLAAKYGEISYTPTNQQSTNPELENAFLTSFAKNTGGFSGALQGGGSYINALTAKGVLTNEDLGKINNLIGVYSQQVKEQNQQARITNIQNAKNQIADINQTLTEAKAAGITSVNILDKNGKVIATVNPQNLGPARLQSLRALSAVGGAATLSYSVPTKETNTEVNSVLTTPTYREDPLSLLARPILEFGASIGAQIKEDIFNPQRNLINESPIVQLITGRPLTGFGTTATVSQSLESAFGVSEEIQKTVSGEYKGIQQVAALGGIISSVAIPVIAGTNIAAKVPEFEGLKARAKGETPNIINQKIAKSFQEKQAEVHQENVGKTIQLTQGTEQEITLKELRLNKAPIQVEKLQSKIVSSKIDIGQGQSITVKEKVPTGTKVQAVQPEFPSGISSVKTLEGIGQIGEKSTGSFPEYKRLSKPEYFFKTLKQSFSSKSPSLDIKIVNAPQVEGSLGFVNLFNKEDIFINIGTEQKGSFTPENIIDTLSHESVHQAINYSVGKEESDLIDVIREETGRFLDLGINPETFTPDFEAPISGKGFEILPEGNYGKFEEKLKTLEGSTFEGQTKPKPIFGKVTKEVPNYLDIKAQQAKSGATTLTEAFISEKQVAFGREPSKLEENALIVKVYGNKAEVTTKLGLNPIEGHEGYFFGKIKTKAQRQYLKEAEKAQLITGKLYEYHLQAKEDIAKASGLYAEVSRNPDIIKGNKFPEIVRPEVVGYREFYPTKPKSFGKANKTPRAFKPMTKFEMSMGLKTGAGAEGKAKSILEPQTKAFTKELNKPELFKTEKANVSYGLTKGYTLTRQRQRQRYEQESEFLQYPKQGTKGILIQTPQITQINKTNFDSILRERTSTKNKEKTTTIFSTKTIPKITNKPTNTTKTSQITGSKLVQKQVTKQQTIYKTPENPFKIPGEPSGKKKLPFGIPTGHNVSLTGLTGGSGARKGYIGNVPENSIIGTYNRQEISYGGVGKSKAHKSTFKMLQGSKKFKI